MKEMPLFRTSYYYQVSKERRVPTSENLLPKALIGKSGDHLRSLLWRRGRKGTKTDSLSAVGIQNPSNT
jgi:hypothetical protein